MIFCPNLSSRAAIKHLQRINMLCDKIHDITDKNGPTHESRNGGHGLSAPKTTMYAEKPMAIQNSMLILTTDTS